MVLALQPVPVVGAILLSCDLEGENKTVYFGDYTPEIEAVTATFRINISDRQETTTVEKYSIDWTGGGFDNHGLVRKSPTVVVRDDTILILENSAVNATTNIEVLAFRQRISLDRFSGGVKLTIHLTEEIERSIFNDSVRREQWVKMRGDCKVITERLF